MGRIATRWGTDARRRARAGSLAFFAVLAACSGPAHTSPDGSVTASVELGTGPTDFVLLTPDVPLVAERGIQGGWHVWAVLRLQGFPAGVTCSGRYRLIGAGGVTILEFLREFGVDALPADESGALRSERLIFPDSDPPARDGELVTLAVELVCQGTPYALESPTRLSFP